MLNIEKYKDKIIEQYKQYQSEDSFLDYHEKIGAAIMSIPFDLGVKGSMGFTFEQTIEWLCEKYKEPILDDKEREYLENIIKPFKENAKVTIELKEIFIEYDRYQYITVTVDGNNFCESFNLPKFDSGKMYKNMKLYHKYTLKELGL